MKVKHGIIRWLETELMRFKHYRLGYVCNSTSVDRDYNHGLDCVFNHPDANLQAVFGPQHGLFGETQDNMVEWESYRDVMTGMPVFSLYGATRIPTPEMLEDIDVMIFDIQDVGSRYYTFIYTMAQVMMACRRDQKKMVVLDRPNPLTGVKMEGNILKTRYASFVGMFPIVIRHGMTIGELALMFNKEFGIGCDLEIVTMDGWKRSMWFDETGVPWVSPSPNMPTLDSAIVYPGMCLLEGTNLSEGRGTTRPFEIFGAPFIEHREFTRHLNSLDLPGVRFRGLRFRPTFQKWKGMDCGGAQIHVTNRNEFHATLTGAAIIQAAIELYPKQFRWRLPPYEYEYEKLPFDILAGTSMLRRKIDSGATLKGIMDMWSPDVSKFGIQREPYLLYD